ncbi:MAG: glutaredoxin family protein [Isosphaeraceae bacterium]|nr:glutaredoxin family protein [Isosphaeraceae bacterium]
MTSLLSRWLQPRVNLAHWHVTVYTRRQCCCCHKAFEVLEEYRRRHRFVMEQIDIDSDPGLVALYDMSVPVVAINGKVRFKGVVNRVLLDRLIAGDL